MGRSKLTLFALLSFLAVTTTKAFSIGASSSLTSLHCSRGVASSSTTRITLLKSTPEDQDDKLKSLGFSDRELQQSRSKGDKAAEPPRVNVQEVEVDPVTLTAIGFGLIAFNFLVLGNLGDGGISGVVASIINTLKQ